MCCFSLYRFIWDRVSSLLGTSLATVKWDIPDDTPEGTYRLTHTGHHKALMRGIGQYYGASNPFKVQYIGWITKLNFRYI